MLEVAKWSIPELSKEDSKHIARFVEEIGDSALRQEVFFLEAVRLLAGPLAAAAKFLKENTTRDARRPSASSGQLVKELRNSMQMFSVHVQSLVFRCSKPNAFGQPQTAFKNANGPTRCCSLTYLENKPFRLWLKASSSRYCTQLRYCTQHRA